MMQYIQNAISQCIRFFRDLFEARFAFSLIEFIGRLLTLFVAHYGCPNSKRTKKLQLKKVLFR